MTATAVRHDPAPEVGPPRRARDQDWRRLARMGGVAVFGQLFIALSGMPVRLDERLVIESVLSLGYLFVGVIPVVVGHRLGRQVRREGVPIHAVGRHELFGGALVGAVAGAGLSGLVLMLTHFDLREPLVNWSPQLRDLLSFGNGPTFGALIWLGIGAAGGFVGGGLRLLPARVRRAVIAMAVTVLMFSILEQLVADVVSGVGLESVADWFYARRGGVTASGAIVLAAASGVLVLVGRGRIKQTRAKLETLEGPARTRANVLLLLVSAAILIVLPLLVGKLTNELLANVGLFVLLALGLNIVVGLAGILDLGYVAFFAVGSYTSAILTAATSPKISPELPWFVALILVVVVTGLVGLFIGAPVIRMRGDYLAIVTLGFGEIIRLLFLSDWLSGWFGGAQGITNIGGVEVFGLTTVDGTSPRKVFYLVLVFCAIAIYVSWRLERSRPGPRLDGGARGRDRGRGHGHQHGQREAAGVCCGRHPRVVQRRHIRLEGGFGVPVELPDPGVDRHPRGGDLWRHGQHLRRDRRRGCAHRCPRRAEAARPAAGVLGVQAAHLRRAAGVDDAGPPGGAHPQRPPDA